MAFKMKSKPVAPVRGSREQLIYSVDDGDSLSELFNAMKHLGVAPDQAHFRQDSDYEGYSQAYVYASVPEDEAHWQHRLSVYKNKLAQYEIWAHDNKDAIEAHKKQQLEKLRAKREKDEQKLLEQMKRQRAAIDKKIKQLEQ